jgi:hypothetical protein
MTINTLNLCNSKSEFHPSATFSFILTLDSSHTYYLTQLYLHTHSHTHVLAHILTLMFQLSHFNVYIIVKAQ